MKCWGLGSFSAGLELTSLRAGFSWAVLREVTYQGRQCTGQYARGDAIGIEMIR